MLKIFHPTYRDFECLAQNCTENCCKVFRVLLFEWERMQLTSKSEWQDVNDRHDKLSDHIHYHNCECSCDKTPDGHCVFLQDNELCGLQLRYGIEALPSVCRTYPRLITKVYDRVEYALDPCCAHTLHLMENHEPGEIIIEGGEEPDDKEYSTRKTSFEKLADRTLSFAEAMEQAAAIYGIVWKSPDVIINHDGEEFLRKATASLIWAYALPYSGHHLHPKPMDAILNFITEYLPHFSTSEFISWDEMAKDYSRSLSDFVKRERFDDEIEGRYIDLLQDTNEHR